MTQDSSPSLKPIIPVAIANILFVSAMGMIIPGMPFFIHDMGGNATEVAHAFAIYSLVSFLCAPIWGRLSDKYGRKKFLITSALLKALSYYMLMSSYEVFGAYSARAMAGLGGAWILIAMATAADVTSAENRAKGIGIIGASFGVGFTIGAGTSGYISSLGVSFADVVFVSIMLSLLAAAVVAFAMVEPNTIKATEQKLLDIRIFDTKIIALLLVGHLFLQLLFTGMEGTFSLWGKAILGLTPKDIGYMLGVSGIVGIIIQGGLLGRLCRRFGEAKIILAGIVFLGIAFVTFINSTTLSMIYLGMVFFGISMALYAPALQSYISLTVNKDQQGVAMGAIQSMASLARIGGPLWAGYLFDTAGTNVPYSISAVLSVPLFIYFYFLLFKKQQ